MIRRAVYRDIPALVRAYVSFRTEDQERHGHHYPPFDPTTEANDLAIALARAFSGGAGFVAVSAEDDGAISGFVVAEVVHRAVGAPTAAVKALYLWVAPDRRAAGIGRNLSAMTAEWGLSQGIVHVEIVAGLGDEQWRSRGFEPFGVLWHANLNDVLVRCTAPHGRVPAPEQPATEGAKAPARKGRRKRKQVAPLPNGKDVHVDGQ